MRRLVHAALMSAAMLAGWDVHQSSAADIAAGKAVAEQQCKGCHGLDGKGFAPGIPDLAGQREGYLLAALNEYKQGLRAHAALTTMFEHLSKADEENVVAYYSSLPPVASATGQQTQIFSPYDHGKALAQACVKCHGENGNSTTPGTPSLAGQQPGYFLVTMQEYLSGAREAAPMNPLIRDLKALDLETLALFFASQTPAQRPPAPFGNAAAGEPLTALCGGCHGLRGVSADSRTPSLAGQDPEYLVKAINAYRTSRKYVPMQRAVAAVSDKDAENIAAYYAVQKLTPVEHGQTLVQDLVEKCNRCHSPTVNNPTLPIPHINGQDETYLAMALRAYHEDKRKSSLMHNMILPYGNAVMEGVASYYASQPPR